MSDLPLADRTFDRLAEFDPLSQAYPIRAVVPTDPRSNIWTPGPNLDQGQEGACVGFGIAGEAGALPVAVAVDDAIAREVYHRAQELDDFPGAEPEVSGSSVLAGAKVAVERGWWGEYRWAFGIDDLILALGHAGPAVLGIPWLSTMGEPASNGVLDCSGEMVGGHCILARGVVIGLALDGAAPRTFILLRNSWGPDWGEGGDAWIAADDLARLLQAQGEACIPVVRTPLA